MPRPGTYRHHIDVLKPVVTPNSIGTPKRTWEVDFQKWAGFDIDYRPTDQFSQTANVQTYETRVWFNLRKTDKITMNHRLRHDGKDYEILSIQDVKGLNRETKILAREVKP